MSQCRKYLPALLLHGSGGETWQQLLQLVLRVWSDLQVRERERFESFLEHTQSVTKGAIGGSLRVIIDTASQTRVVSVCNNLDSASEGRDHAYGSSLLHETADVVADGSDVPALAAVEDPSDGHSSGPPHSAPTPSSSLQAVEPSDAFGELKVPLTSGLGAAAFGEEPSDTEAKPRPIPTAQDWAAWIGGRANQPARPTAVPLTSPFVKAVSFRVQASATGCARDAVPDGSAHPAPDHVSQAEQLPRATQSYDDAAPQKRGTMQRRFTALEVEKLKRVRTMLADFLLQTPRALIE